MTANRLAAETSPYLLQHQDNPVHWQPWDNQALTHAKTENKPILLSIGYAACHWCHVMAHESFEDDAIAGLMNDLYVNIKVDREERPDLDSIYQNALSLLGEQGGWPLTMFLTPDGEPFWGGTYFPSAPRYGRPGFPDILRRVSEIYHQQPDTITKNTTALVDALQKMALPPPDAETTPLSADLLDTVAQRLTKEVDPFLGGIGSAPKFPQPHALELIWRAYLRSGDETYARAVHTTLLQMCQGGIYDHLSGGFARYATDDRWLIPHFEKMLYDNAQLIDLLTLVWQHDQNPIYRARIYETVDWLFREMIAEGGAFASSLDADSEGEEGKFYVWSELEINRLLGSDAHTFKTIYDVAPEGNWEGKTILNRSRSLTFEDPETEAQLAAQRRILLDARAARIRPGWDDKVLADWNGLTIAALASAARVFNEPTWTRAAIQAFQFIANTMFTDGRFLHSYRAGKCNNEGMLDDYANMTRAALTLYEALGDVTYLNHAETWHTTANDLFWDEKNGGYFISATTADDLIVRQRHCNDHAVPAGNATLAAATIRLWHFTGNSAYRDRADAIFAAFSPELRRNYFPLTSYLNAFDLMRDPIQIVIIAAPDDDASKALLDTVHTTSLPNKLLSQIDPDASLPPTHPAAGKVRHNDQPTAYVCIGETCSLPVTDPDALEALLPRPPETH